MYLQAASLQPTMQELLVHHSCCNRLLRGCHARLCVIGCFSISLNKEPETQFSGEHPARLGSKAGNPRGGFFAQNAFQAMGGDFWSQFFPLVRRPVCRK
jgi:hypothetical protein